MGVAALCLLPIAFESATVLLSNQNRIGIDIIAHCCIEL